LNKVFRGIMGAYESTKKELRSIINMVGVRVLLIYSKELGFPPFGGTKSAKESVVQTAILEVHSGCSVKDEELRGQEWAQVVSKRWLQ
jgi:hypothetical protein